MAVIGFNFTKIEGQKKTPLKGKIEIKNNINVADIKEFKLNIGKSSESCAQVLFKSSTDYEPGIGNINLEGELLFVAQEKVIKDLLSKWKKEKKVDPQIMAQILNNIASKANIKALVLSQELNLPAPIPLPKVNVKK